MFKLAEAFVEITAKDAHFQSSLNRIETSVKRVGGSLKALAGLAAGAFAAGQLGGAMKSVADEAIDMEYRLSQVRKTTGLTGAELDTFKDQILRLGTTMAGVKLTDLFDIAVAGGRLGVASDKIAGFTKDIAMITIALDDIPADEAATNISRILNVFQMGTDKAINLASALNRLDDTSTATGRDILQISQQIAGTAAVLGMTPQKVLALSAALKDSGSESMVAATAIDQVFMKMAVNAKGFAKVAGVSAAEFSQALRGDPLEAIRLLINGLKRFEAQSQLRALESLGMEGQKTAGTLLRLGAVMDKLTAHVATSEEQWETHTSIYKEVAIQAGTTRAQLERVGNAIQVTASKLGTFFLPVIKTVGTAVARLSEDIRGFLDRNKATIEAFATWLEGAGGRLGLAFSEMPTMLALAGAEIKDKLLKIQEVMTRFGSRAWDQLTWGATSAVTVLKNLFNGLRQYLADLFEGLGDTLTAKFHKVVAEVTRDLAKTRLGNLLGVGDEQVKAAEGQVHLDKMMMAGRAKGRAAPPDPLTPDRVLAGVKPPPAFDFKGIFRDLDDPGREAQKAKLRAKLDAAAAARGAGEKAEAAKAMNPDGGGGLEFGKDMAKLKDGLLGALVGEKGALAGAMGRIGKDLAESLGADAPLAKAIGQGVGFAMGGKPGFKAATEPGEAATGQPKGTKIFEEETKKQAAFSDPMQFVKDLQVGIFGGGGDAKKTADNTGKLAQWFDANGAKLIGTGGASTAVAAP